MSIKKSMQPNDVNLSKLRYSCLVSPKIDGVKLVRFNSVLTGRSFKQFRNRHLNQLFDKHEYEGFEGEVIVGTNPYADDLCRNTTSAVNSFEGEPVYTWMLFDYVTDETINLTYEQRRELLISKLPMSYEGVVNFEIVECSIVYNEQELLEYEAEQLELGAEGIIIRDTNSKYKQGRSSENSQECLRLKRFSDSEAIIIGFAEEMYNGNEATIDELGRTSRSSHQDNLVGKNTLGSLIVKDIRTGVEFSIGSGFDDDTRLTVWDKRDSYLGAVVKYKFFNKGIKNLPRFPTFLSWRSQVDMEN